MCRLGYLCFTDLANVVDDYLLTYSETGGSEGWGRAVLEEETGPNEVAFAQPRQQTQTL